MESINIGLAGLGTVAQGFLEIFGQKKKVLSDKLGRELKIAKVASRSQKVDLEEFGAIFSTELSSLVEDPAIAAFLMTNLERANGGFQWRVNLPAIATAMSEISGFPVLEGAVFGGPTAFIAGEHSAYIHQNHSDRVLELFPKARIVTIKDASHWVHADQPEAFRRTLSSFIATVV